MDVGSKCAFNENRDRGEDEDVDDVVDADDVDDDVADCVICDFGTA